MQLKPPNVKKASGRYVWTALEIFLGKTEGVSVKIKASCCNPPPISTRELKMAEKKSG